MAIEHIRHWKIGDVEVARIVEVNNWEDDIAMLLPDGKAEFVQKFPWLVPHFATPAGKMLISFQCFVLQSRDKRVMPSTVGSGNAKVSSPTLTMRACVIASVYGSRIRNRAP